MFDLRTTGSALDTFHQRFTDDSLPESLSTEAFAAFKPELYDATVLARGGRAWQLRALDEYRSQLAFSELLVELTEAGFAFDVLGTAVRVTRDEARHVELCRRMMRALGAPTRVEATPAWVRSDRSLPVRTRVLRTIVGSLCIGETFSVRLLAAVRQQARDSLAHGVLTVLLADESIHSRFGWTLLELFLPLLTRAERADLHDSLPGFMAACDAVVVAPGARGGHSLACAPENPFGSLDPASRARVFDETLERDILQPFELFGIPARAAWDKVRPRS